MRRFALLLLVLGAVPVHALDLVDRARIPKLERREPDGRPVYVASLAPYTGRLPLFQIVPASAGGGGGGTVVITSGSTAIASGLDTAPCFDDAGVINCSDADWAFLKATGSLASKLGVWSTDLLATSANALSAQETAGCFTFEGSSADTIQTRLCVTNPTGADTTINLPNVAASATVATRDASQTFTGTQIFSGVLYGVGPLAAVTTTATTSAATAGTGSAITFTNTGDADGSAITLMNDPTAGTFWNFAVTVGQTVTITASAGETLYHGATACGTSLTSNTIGSTITIRTVVGGSGGVFMTYGGNGTWVCTP